MATDKIGFIGTGQMARALARGIAGSGSGSPLVGHDKTSAAAEQFARETPGALILATNREVIEYADVIILAVKPQHLQELSEELRPLNRPDKLVVSLLAGVPIRRLIESLAHDRVVRVMPNTPCLVGCGASAYSVAPGVSESDGERVSHLLAAVGTSCELEESLLDAVTGLSGSGPAYVYTVIEALSDGGVRVGLPRAIATRLAAQTVLGAAQMVLSAGDHPAVLRDRVTSPGGTTIAGLQVLERGGMRSALIDAVEAAARRAAELGRSTG